MGMDSNLFSGSVEMKKLYYVGGKGVTVAC